MLFFRVQFVLFNRWIMFLNLIEYLKITFHLYNLGNDPLKRWKNLECWLLLFYTPRLLETLEHFVFTNFSVKSNLIYYDRHQRLYS